MPRPFLKWVGGKRKLVSTLLNYVPARFGVYHEPFVGGGALFFALASLNTASGGASGGLAEAPPCDASGGASGGLGEAPPCDASSDLAEAPSCDASGDASGGASSALSEVFLSDTNVRLVRTYQGVKEHVEDVIFLLESYPRSRGFFEEFAKKDIDARSDAEVAAWFIYLNHMCYNGLYRENASGQFNVGYGKCEDAKIFDAENLRACSRALANATIQAADFQFSMPRAKRGDFVYCDPPYLPESGTPFVGYGGRRFGEEDHVRLRDTVIHLLDIGVNVLVSNAATEKAKNWYSDPRFSVEEVVAQRCVSRDSGGRKSTIELLIRRRYEQQLFQGWVAR